jgi:hypothetical protein
MTAMATRRPTSSLHVLISLQKCWRGALEWHSWMQQFGSGTMLFHVLHGVCGHTAQPGRGS